MKPIKTHLVENISLYIIVMRYIQNIVFHWFIIATYVGTLLTSLNMYVHIPEVNTHVHYVHMYMSIACILEPASKILLLYCTIGTANCSHTPARPHSCVDLREVMYIHIHMRVIWME